MFTNRLNQVLQQLQGSSASVFGLAIIAINVACCIKMKNIISRNPYSGEVKEQFAYFTTQMIQKCMQRSQSAFSLHSRRSVKEKTGMIKALLPQIDKKKNEIAKLITFETGKPISAAEGEVRQAIKMCEYYSTHSEAILSLNVKAMARKKTLIKYLPTGTVYCILPYTSPFSLAFYHSLPQLLLGNCLIAKHSATTPAISRIVEKIMTSAGFESGEYQQYFVQREKTEEILCRSQITGVSFTGSTEAGSEVASIAGKFLKPSALHLGSNDSMIILEDADFDSAVSILMKNSAFISGNGPKRIIVKALIFEEFKGRLIEKAQQVRYGNPFEKETQIGPISRPDILLKAQAQLQALQPSFKVVYQRQGIERPFFPITIVEGGKQPFDQEIMAPVYFLYKAADSAEIISLANKSRFGSSQYIFGSKADEIVPFLDGGSIYINQSESINCSVPRGGTKLSGYGRQGGHQGTRNFANIKTVYIN